MIFSLYSMMPLGLNQSLNEEKILSIFTDQDGETGSLVHGWAITGSSSLTFQSDLLNDFDIDSQDDIYAVGSFTDTETFGSTNLQSSSNNDGFLAKISEEGAWELVKKFSGSYDLSLEKVSVNSAGNIAVAGHFSDESISCDDLTNVNIDSDGGSNDIFVAVLDSNFDCVWMNTVGGEDNDAVNELILNDDGTVLIGGIIQDIVYFGSEGTDGTAEDGFVSKFTNQGDMNWGYRINGINDQSVNAILVNSDGSIYVGGDSDNKAEIDGGGEGKSSNKAGFMLKLDNMENIHSLVPIPGIVVDIEKNPVNSDIFISGTFSGAKDFGGESITSAGYRDIFVSKYMFPDNYSNINQASSSDVVDLYSMEFTPDGNVLLSGSWGKLFDDFGLTFGSLSIDSNDYIDAFVASLDPYAGWNWAIRGTSDRDDIAVNAIEDSKGSLIIGGSFAISHENEMENAIPDGLELIGTTLEPTSRQSHMFVWKLLVDTDMDGIGSMNDDCEGGETGWTSTPSTDRDSDGCRDAGDTINSGGEDSDDDNDGVTDFEDNCPRGEINWVSDVSNDPDGDGCKIDLEGPFLENDLDSDGIIDELDIDPTDSVIRSSPTQGTNIEDLPVNASFNRTDYVDVPQLPMLGNDDGTGTDLDSSWFDVDGDGDYDFLQSGKIYRTINGELESTNSMSYCDGNDCDGPLSVGDINGDGRLDIVDSYGVHLNYGNGFTSSVDWMPEETCTGVENYIVSEVALGDLSGNGRADLYIGFQGEADCIYYANNMYSLGDPMSELFSLEEAPGEIAPTSMDKIGTTTAVELVDFNQDGMLDIVRLIKSSYLQVIFNEGMSSGQPFYPNSMGNYQSLPIPSAEEIDVGDLDADGDVDVLVATTHEQPDRIYLNNQTNGLHNLTLEWTSYQNTYSSRAKISDIDGDGDLDYSLGGLVYLNPASGVVNDADNDGMSDDIDGCIVNRNYFTNTLVDFDGDGCHDLLDDLDDDDDGVLDEDDNCPSGDIYGTTSFVSTPENDLDGDGCEDGRDDDADGDGVPDDLDECRFSDQDRIWEVDTEGVEYDSEGVPAEEGSELGCHPGESDKDNDGVVDEIDALPRDSTQDTDSDGDGFFDNPPPATLADDCPGRAGTSTVDRKGCSDQDGDGWSDIGDKYPFDSSQWADPTDDTDGDGLFDTEDNCPNEAGGSGYDSQGNPTDRIGCKDSDGDGWSDADDLWLVSDGADAYPNDPNKHILEDENGNTDEGEGNNTGNGTGNEGDNLNIDTSSDMTMYYVGAGILAFLLLLVFVIWMMRGRDDDDEDYDEYAEELLSDEEVVGGMFRKKTRKKQRDDYGYGDQKAQVGFGQRPGARPSMQSGEQRQYQDTGYYGEESRYDSYYGGSGESANVGSGYTPTNSMKGKVGDDGYEWLEFPENTDRWWWREKEGDTWSAWE